MIIKTKSGYEVWDEKKTKRLGKHKTLREAQAQLGAIEASKKRRGQ